MHLCRKDTFETSLRALMVASSWRADTNRIGKLVLATKTSTSRSVRIARILTESKNGLSIKGRTDAKLGALIAKDGGVQSLRRVRPCRIDYVGDHSGAEAFVASGESLA